MENFDFDKYNHNFIKEILTSEISEEEVGVYLTRDESGRNINNTK